nr:S8 family serine peptidase [Nocardioides luti]
MLPAPVQRLALRRQQDAVLAKVGSPVPVYRWTTALNGFAVRLDRTQAADLAALPQVELVEENAVRHLTGAPATAAPQAPTAPGRGGASVVIGVVDSGISPESPLFASVSGLGRAPRGFSGQCAGGEDWPDTTCNDKVLAARWYVDGFGSDRVRTTASLSARDDDGHGTQMASIAAGNPGVSVRVNEQRLGSYAGAAPQARLAVYKACWTAPDPADDGCATADLVTAIDQATTDGVDVLNLSVDGPATFDTVERALLGAAEDDVVVVAAAGNDPRHSFAAHPGPWVTTVGGTTGAVRRGQVRVAGGGPTLPGAMASTRGTGADPVRVVLGSAVAAPDATREQARTCQPGSLDASRVAGTIVLCDRGVIGRVDKSAAVEQADGVGMVLANVGAGALAADFHSVPTVHVNRTDARALRSWLAGHPGARATLHPLGVARIPTRVARDTAAGDPTGPVLKPDVAAPAVGVLGAVPPAVRSTRWDFVSGTSAATAHTAGLAAVLRGEHRRWSASVVRSALATSAVPVAGGSALTAGAGRVRASAAATPGLAFEVDPLDYRRWLEGDRTTLNTPSVLLAGAESSTRRTVTNVGRRAMYFSSSARGFTRHRVTVTPAAVRLAPGESATFTIRVTRPAGPLPLDDGTVRWLGANGTLVSIPVLISR